MIRLFVWKPCISLLSSLFPNESIGDNALDSENENTSEPSIKKSKLEELNDILLLAPSGYDR